MIPFPPKIWRSREIVLWVHVIVHTYNSKTAECFVFTGVFVADYTGGSLYSVSSLEKRDSHCHQLLKGISDLR